MNLVEKIGYAHESTHIGLLSYFFSGGENGDISLANNWLSNFVHDPLTLSDVPECKREEGAKAIDLTVRINKSLLLGIEVKVDSSEGQRKGKKQLEFQKEWLQHKAKEEEFEKNELLCLTFGYADFFVFSTQDDIRIVRLNKICSILSNVTFVPTLTNFDKKILDQWLTLVKDEIHLHERAYENYLSEKNNDKYRNFPTGLWYCIYGQLKNKHPQLFNDWEIYSGGYNAVMNDPSWTKLLKPKFESYFELNNESLMLKLGNYNTRESQEGFREKTRNFIEKNKEKLKRIGEPKFHSFRSDFKLVTLICKWELPWKESLEAVENRTREIRGALQDL